MIRRLLILGSLLILIPFYLFSAEVSVSVNKSAVYPGDSVVFSIKASGNDIEFPKIDKIGNADVSEAGTSSSYVIINGNASKTLTKMYSFTPDNNVTIPSFTVKIDGKEYKTKPINVTVLNPNAPRPNAKALLEIRADKNSSYVGEPVNIELVLKLKASANIAKAQIDTPKFDNLWVKQIGDVQKTQEGDYIVQKYRFLAFAQQAGKIKIGPITAHYATVKRDSYDPFGGMNISIFGENLVWKKILSNSITIDAKPLPNGLELYGDFDIKAKVDKSKVSANKPVNLTVTVSGVGNIDDVKKFDLDIPNAIVYADEPQIKSGFKGGKYGGIFTQKIAIIADRNYTIPPIELRYFDKTAKKETVKKTEPIKITVIGGKTAAAPAQIAVANSQKPAVLADTNSSAAASAEPAAKNCTNGFIKYITLIIGFILGALAALLWQKRGAKKEQKELPVIKKIKKAKSDKELYKILLPFANDSKLIANKLKKLEENIYKNGKNKIKKEALFDYFEDMEEK